MACCARRGGRAQRARAVSPIHLISPWFARLVFYYRRARFAERTVRKPPPISVIRENDDDILIWWLNGVLWWSGARLSQRRCGESRALDRKRPLSRFVKSHQSGAIPRETCRLYTGIVYIRDCYIVGVGTGSLYTFLFPWNTSNLLDAWWLLRSIMVAESKSSNSGKITFLAGNRVWFTSYLI